ncbi:PhoH family protein [Actinomyces sp. oral taxon 181]|uniref:PhoH family protein n=1 Tax=Actinomyces sp. oral taxon 181 TaxID=712121 RepID=UPI0002A2C76F|nr:PhoH family protein [Actinomyces sp. oral taxon 181]EKY14994.1 PhoH family protein [Actinomyces sp. oral taxon 181 str. F0379]
MDAKRIDIPRGVDPVVLFGTSDRVLRALENGFPQVRFTLLGRSLSMIGPEGIVDMAAQLVEELIELARDGHSLDADGVEQAIALLMTASSTDERPQEILRSRGRSIRPQSAGQKAYVEAIQRSTVVFGLGPAGTGKTYLAMAQAVSSLLSGQVRRIVLTRPAVEAGENLGFLPGTLTDKIDPYLRPLYDALGDMMDPDALPKLMASGAVEVAPLAYMRGRTLNDSFIILDEAQNTTLAQMKMFLTRLGFNSKVVVTGDASQIDLAGERSSGLLVIEDILSGIDDIEFCHLTSADVVRHRLVGQIIDAYERWDESMASLKARRDRSLHTRNRHNGR